MGLITKTVEVGLGVRNIKYYENLGYEIPREKNKWGRLGTPRETKIIVKTEHLQDSSRVILRVQCDGEDCKNPHLNPMTWQSYKRYVKEDGKYYCNKCMDKFVAGEKSRLTRLANGTSFEKWCTDNLSKEESDNVLIRWDCELNDKLPNRISYGTKEKYWFKCPQGIHKSELKDIHDFTSGQEGSMFCNSCNSFAQYLINLYGENALELYWDYNKNIFDPWKISKCGMRHIFIICQEKDYNGSYETCTSRFINGCRCPYCTTRNGKVHPLDSLGKLLEDKDLLYLWNDKNSKSPYNYTPMSHQKVWWKCPDGKHEDYYRGVKATNKVEFRCPECNCSKGEIKISQYLIKNNFIKYEDYIPQKPFNGLVGLGNGSLSYDFYLPKYNLLIEYQGEQHDHPVDFLGKGKEYAENQFKNQQEHDRRKKQYADENDIKLLEIWYWDFDNIETILDKELKKRRW